MKWDITFKGKITKFPGEGGWVYIAVPKKYTEVLKQQRRTWGMYPITAEIGVTTWRTKLMMKKGGDFFVALNKSIRDKENIIIGSRKSISFKFD